ncbi:MAG: carbon-nitrogen hydrolase family protein [Acidobacteriota bacterium]
MRRLGLGLLLVLLLVGALAAAHGPTTDYAAAPAAADPEKRAVREIERLLDDGQFAAPHGWRLVVSRPEISPEARVDDNVGHRGPSALVLAGKGNPDAAGYWEKEVEIKTQKHYRLTAFYQPRDVPHPRQTIHARVDWQDAAGERVGYPDYIAESYRDGSWRRVDRVLQAPDGAKKARIQLVFQWCAAGQVWWDDVRFSSVTPPAPRKVRVATIFHRPSGLKSAAENIESFAAVIEKAAESHPDIICLPEGMTIVGTRLKYAAVAEPIPGPSTQRLSELARKHKTYLVAGLLEREGASVFNTSVLIDRDGKLAGKYRKVYLPREEVEGGITPGSDFPVFDTDFGRVGMMICYDSFFVDPARALAARGAEIILMPIWGGDELLVRARALENHLTLVTSSYDMRTGVVDPLGKFVASADASNPIAIAEVDLDAVLIEKWLGDMRGRFRAELRDDVPLKP